MRLLGESVLSILKLKVIKLDLCRLHPQHPAAAGALSPCDSMYRTVKRFGQLMPIHVNTLPPSELPFRYEILSGARIVQALRMAGWAEAIATVHDHSPADQLALMYVLQELRRPWSPAAARAVLQGVLDASLGNTDAAAAAVGATLSQYEALLDGVAL